MTDLSDRIAELSPTHTDRETARLIGCSNTTVCRIRHALGIERSQGYRTPRQSRWASGGLGQFNRKD